MAAPLNARRLADRIRQKIEDRDRLVFSNDTEILEAADEALEAIHTETRLAGRSHSQDFLDVSVSSLVSVSDEVRGYTLPQYVADVRLVEMVSGDGAIPTQISRADLELKDAGRTRVGIGFPVWHFSKRSGPGQIEIRGRVSDFTSMRIYFTRRWGTMFYGTVGVGSDSAQLTGWTDVNGRLLQQSGLYQEMQIEVYEDTTNPQNVDHTSYITGYDRSTRTFSLETPLPALPTPGVTKAALVVPMEPEHSDYLSTMASFSMMQRLGNYTDMQAISSILSQQRDAFERGLNQRDVSTQRGWFNRYS